MSFQGLDWKAEERTATPKIPILPIDHRAVESSLIGTAIALPLLAILAVILRFYARLHLRKSRIEIDDWLALLAVVFVCGHGVVQIAGMQSC